MLTSTAVADTGNVLIDALTWGSKWSGGVGPLKINVGFKLIDGLLPTLAETAAVQNVLAEFERVINVDFTFIGVDQMGNADLTFQIENDAWDTSYGWSTPLGEPRLSAYGDANILRSNYADPATQLVKGSFDYITFLHEFAHVMGLAHPHDAGGGSGIFPGVSSPTSTGLFDLNQGVYTTMSYNDGRAIGRVAVLLSYWREDSMSGVVETGSNRSDAQSDAAHLNSGNQSGLMALDIMALQILYGANTNQASEDTRYLLPTENTLGTSYQSIWDTGGVDSIVMAGGADCNIDLRCATGLVAEGGGGFVSSVLAVNGGFTIAAGVDIENATGGTGNDMLTGNALANRLEGGLGLDVLMGLGGKDILIGGAGADQFVFISDLDSGPTVLSADVIQDFNVLTDVIDLTGIDANSALAGNQEFHYLGGASSFAAAAEIRWGYSNGNTVLYLNTDADMSTESVIVLNGIISLSANDFLL